MDVKDIKKIVEMVRTNDLVEFELEDGDFRLYLRGASDAPAVAYPPSAAPMMMAPPPPAAAAVPAAVPGADAVAPADADDGLVDIVSPIVGTFYAASSPDAAPYVKVGDTINEESVVCIVEAMKVMNEIKAETKGTIRKIMVDNATPVEFGQVLFKVEPA